MTTLEPTSAPAVGASAPRGCDLWFAGSLMRVLADHESTDGQMAVIEQHAARGFSPPLHVHHREDQMLYVLDGTITALVGDTERVAGTGAVVWLPRDTSHTFRVDSDTARLLEVTTPAGFEQFHVDAGDIAQSVRIPDPAPPDVDRMLNAIGRYGAEIIGPPMHA